jgi:hypothetical protein
MDKLKILDCTKDLKTFFVSHGVMVSEAKEAMFRMIDYIDNNYDEDKLEVMFRNGNGNGVASKCESNYKTKGLDKLKGGKRKNVGPRVN